MRRRWLVVGVWVVIIAGGSFAIGPLFAQMGDTTVLTGTETGDAQEAIDNGIERGVEFYAVVDNIDPNAQQTVEVLDRAIADVQGIAGVQEVSGPGPSNDGRAVVISVTLDRAESVYVPFTNAQNRLLDMRGELPNATVQIGGGDLISDEANEAVQNDLSRAELYSLPLTLIVLVIVFGGVIAAGLPTITAIATMLGSTAILLGFSAFVTLDANVITVITLLGLGLSIDYGLLLVARYREELVHTGNKVDAVAAAWSTAGRTIFFSALTVAAALTGLMAFDIGRLQALAAAGIVTALVGMLSALTLTAALLGFVGDRITPWRRARHSVAVSTEMETGFFVKLARGTQRRPVLVLVGCVGALLVMAIPFLQVTLKDPQLDGLPRSLESVQVADVLNARFGQTSQAGAQIVARTDTATLDAYGARWASDPEVARVEPAVALNPNLSVLTFAVNGDGQNQDARDLVERLRADRPVGYESWINGDAARMIDLNNRLQAGLPLAVLIVILAMTILLFMMTGSVVIPLKAIVMSVLSLAATFGVLVAIFQWGWFSGPLDTLTVGGLSPYMIVIVFAFAFGLSMDYEVFLLARIKEYRDGGDSTNAAVRHGLQRSGRIITSAAALMLIVFACFAAAKVGALEQIGLGLFVAVLIDATIVRCLLVPAAMMLLGNAAWWAPAPLRRLHNRYGIHETDATAEHAGPAEAVTVGAHAAPEEPPSGAHAATGAHAARATASPIGDQTVGVG